MAITIKDFHLDNILIDEKSYKNILVYDISYLFYDITILDIL